eukprot:IDg2923t1
MKSSSDWKLIKPCALDALGQTMSLTSITKIKAVLSAAFPISYHKQRFLFSTEGATFSKFPGCMRYIRVAGIVETNVEEGTYLKDHIPFVGQWCYLPSYFRETCSPSLSFWEVFSLLDVSSPTTNTATYAIVIPTSVTIPNSRTGLRKIKTLTDRPVSLLRLQSDSHTVPLIHDCTSLKCKVDLNGRQVSHANDDTNTTESEYFLLGEQDGFPPRQANVPCPYMSQRATRDKRRYDKNFPSRFAIIALLPSGPFNMTFIGGTQPLPLSLADCITAVPSPEIFRGRYLFHGVILH